MIPYHAMLPDQATITETKTNFEYSQPETCNVMKAFQMGDVI